MKKFMKPFYSILLAIAIVAMGDLLSHVFAVAYTLVIIGHYKLCVTLMALFKDPAFKATMGAFNAFAQAIRIVAYRIIAEVRHFIVAYRIITKAKQINPAQKTVEVRKIEEKASTAK